MQEFISGLCERTGISEEQAGQVVEFLKENASKVPELLSGDIVGSVKDKIGGGLGGLLG